MAEPTGGPGTATINDKGAGKRAKRTAKEVDAGQMALADTAIAPMVRVEQGDVRHGFPAPYITPTPVEDSHWQARKFVATQMGQGLGSDRAMATVPVTEQDIQYIQKKLEQFERIAFDDWFGQQFDTSDINVLHKLQEMYPEYFQMREQYLDWVCDNQKRIALIKLRGPRNMDDLKLIYSIEKYKKDNGETPAWMKVNIMKPWEAYDGRETQQYMRGIFSPKALPSFQDNTKGAGLVALERRPGRDATMEQSPYGQWAATLGRI